MGTRSLIYSPWRHGGHEELQIRKTLNDELRRWKRKDWALDTLANRHQVEE